MPLHTLRADIDYATSTARTTYGCIGVKVWICRGEILDQKQAFKGEDEKRETVEEAPATARSRRPHRGEKGRKRPRGRVRRPEATRPSQPPKGRHPEATPPAQPTTGPDTRPKAAAADKADKPSTGPARKRSEDDSK